ncbi:MAG: B12-binding domain-containing radical SAM protein, partial [bacterium]|nr:B12-binding domain-containing radical SAM protein [bacterium]
MTQPNQKKNILLLSLPFWTPLIPPLGPACLKSHLQKKGHSVKAVDANVEDGFKEIYNNYFDKLKERVPEEKKGNFYSIGHDVLRNHLMAHMNYEDEAEYISLVKNVVYQTYYTTLETDHVLRLSEILDEFYKRLKDYVLEKLEESKPGILGLSVYSDTLPASLYVFKLTREKYPYIKTVMGGGVFADQMAPGSINLENFLKKTEGIIDTIIIGEGEGQFLKYLEGQMTGKQRVYTRHDPGTVKMDLDAAEPPDFSDYQLEYYPYMTDYMSRSCPFQCSFCAETVNWGEYRKKGIEKAVDELEQLYREYRRQLFLIADSLLNPIADALSEELIKRDLALYWDGYLRADKHVCNEDRALKWRRGGFYRARLGIESGSPRILEAMGKDITPQQIKEAVSALAHAGIKTTTYWIVGYPGETEEDFQQTLALVEELKNNLYEVEFKPFYYHLTGQVKSEDWLSEYQRVLLYPEEAKEMLMNQTWIIDCEPRREVTFRRINRFVQHCKKLGIPNPYTIHEIYQADERWKTLHKTAVPSVAELENTDN